MMSLAEVERFSQLEMEAGLVPRILIWSWLSRVHPDWSDEQIFERERMARPVLMASADTVQ